MQDLMFRDSEALPVRHSQYLKVLYLGLGAGNLSQLQVQVLLPRDTFVVGLLSNNSTVGAQR